MDRTLMKVMCDGTQMKWTQGQWVVLCARFKTKLFSCSLCSLQDMYWQFIIDTRNWQCCKYHAHRMVINSCGQNDGFCHGKVEYNHLMSHDWMVLLLKLSSWHIFMWKCQFGLFLLVERLWKCFSPTQWFHNYFVYDLAPKIQYMKFFKLSSLKFENSCKFIRPL